jgi:hypothetical protein
VNFSAQMMSAECAGFTTTHAGIGSLYVARR